MFVTPPQPPTRRRSDVPAEFIHRARQKVHSELQAIAEIPSNDTTNQSEVRTVGPPRKPRSFRLPYNILKSQTRYSRHGRSPLAPSDSTADLPELVPVSSISSASTISTVSTGRDSIFSATSATSATSTASSVPPYSLGAPKYPSSSSATGLAPLLTLEEALPSSYTDWYTPEVLASTPLTPEGRPTFTSRDLIDWRLNDIRSQLIIPELRPEWHGVLPIIFKPACEFFFTLLPLHASDSEIVSALVASDIYVEHFPGGDFRIQTARYTVATARQRHAAAGKPFSHPGGNMLLTKPEWRNIIENYLLNLACEAQCRVDYRIECGKRDIPPDKAEKQRIWAEVQAKLYKRMGLDWQVDGV